MQRRIVTTKNQTNTNLCGFSVKLICVLSVFLLSLEVVLIKFVVLINFVVIL